MIFEFTLVVIPLLLASLFSIMMGSYVLLKNPKQNTNISFFLFCMSIFFSAFFQGLKEIVAEHDIALFLGKMQLGSASTGALFLAMFSHYFPIEKKTTIKLKYLNLLIAIPIILLAFLVVATNFVVYDVEYSGSAHNLVLGPYLFYWIILLLGYCAYIVYNFLSAYIIHKSRVVKMQLMYLVIGALMTLLIVVPYNISDILFGTVLPNIGTSFIVIFLLFVSIAILKYKLFIIEPSAEELNETPQKYLLEKGLSYLVKEEKLDKSYEIFYDQVTHGSSGLAITKLPPDKVRERYRITKSPILWLTFKEVESAISPKDIEGVKSAISDFLGKAEKPVILLDCFDQIMLANGFEKSISMLREVKDICRKNNANLLLSINPEMFEKEQIATIEKELKEIKVQHG